MSRSGYSEEYEYMALWRANVERSIAGKRGQVFLKDLLAALDAMPEKRLVADVLVSSGGEVCGLGCLGKARNLNMDGVDISDPKLIGKLFGISGTMAAEVSFINDEYWPCATPEERWVKVRAWVAESIGADA